MARFTNTCNSQWGTYYIIYLDITQNSQNISNNTSNVTVHLWAQSTNSAYHAYNLEGGNPVSLYVNNTLVDPHNQNMDFRNQQIVELSTWSGDITHNADGTGSVTASGSFTIYGTSSLSSGSVSGNLGLTTIPRTSIMTIEPSKQTMGSTITLKTNRNSTSFTHNFEYKFGNNSGTIATGVGDSTSWTVPVELAHQVPNSTSGSGTIICHTYSGNTHIGTSQAGFQANVPENYKPSLSITAVSEATSGIAAKFGAYIKGKSKLTITVTGNGSYSSSIKSYRVEVNGSTYTGGAGSSYKLTTGALWTSGSNTIKATVTDSRGRSSSQSKTVTVLDYTAPTITALSVVRSNADGTANSSGDHMKITYAGSITALNNKNDKTFTVYYKESTASTYNQATTYTSGYSVNSSVILAADINKSYDILFRAKDYFQQVDKTTSVTTAFVLMDLHNSGTSIAFGKVAETSNMLDVNLAAHFRKNVEIGNIKNLESSINDLGTKINNLNSSLGNKMDKSGGTITGSLSINNTLNIGSGKVKIWADNEGGNLSWFAPDGTRWEIDAYNGNARLFTYANNVKGIQISKNGSIWADGNIETGKQVSGNIISSSNGVYAFSGKPCIYANDGMLKYISDSTSSSSPYFHFQSGNAAWGINCWKSDARLKHNIKDSTINALRTILAIPHKEFIWNDCNQKVKLGYIAQQLESLNPEFVFKVDQSECNSEYEYLYQIAPDKIIPYITKAIQELYQIIDQRLTNHINYNKLQN